MSVLVAEHKEHKGMSGLFNKLRKKKKEGILNSYMILTFDKT